MIRPMSFVSALAVFGLVVSLGSAGLRTTRAQDGAPPTNPEALTGTAFTYQGQLKNSGTPLTGTCGMQFALYDTAGVGTGNQVGATISTTVPVTNGLFTVALNFFSHIFTGEARWLDIKVKCGSDVGFTQLTPRQALTAVPYALALPGLWTYDGGGVANLIGGYSGNDIGPESFASVIGGGGDALAPNFIQDNYSVIDGGRGNQSWGDANSIGGGEGNTVGNVANRPDYATIGGGHLNLAMGDDATVSGGYSNTVSGSNGTVSGGYSNTVASNGNVGGGFGNIAYGAGAVVGGGYLNYAGGPTGATVAGGVGNNASHEYTAIGGGSSNDATGLYATVGGGHLNTASGQASAILGGANNIASGDYSTVGGEANTASGNKASVMGGYNNTVSGAYGAISGGYGNMAFGTGSVVGGGISNYAGGPSAAVVAGGSLNSATTDYATVSGGLGNTASGISAMIPGGFYNTASGNSSFAAGYRASAIHNGAFVWADEAGTPISSTATNQFLIRASGGIILYSNAGATSGVSLAPGSGSWTSLSDRNFKTNFTLVNSRDILAKVAALPIQTWNYTSQDAAIRHIGPMAQDFYAAFNVGETDTGISVVDADGVALAAIQGLNDVVAEKEAQITAQNVRLTALETRLAALEAAGSQSAPDNTWLPWLLLGGLALFNLGLWAGRRWAQRAHS